MEKARIMVVRYGINYVKQRTHMGEGQLVVLTSPLEPVCGLKMGDTIVPDTWVFPISEL